MPKEERKKNILRDLSCYYVIGVGEGVHASYVMINVWGIRDIIFLQSLITN
jgi:hypothetical protein